jgi:hypothetical protein
VNAHEFRGEVELAIDLEDPQLPPGFDRDLVVDMAAQIASNTLTSWGGSTHDSPPAVIESAIQVAVVDVARRVLEGHGIKSTVGAESEEPRASGRNPIDELAVANDPRIIRCPRCNDPLGAILSGGWLTMRGRAEVVHGVYKLSTQPASIDRARSVRTLGFADRDITTLAELPTTVRCGGKPRSGGKLRSDRSCRSSWRIDPSGTVKSLTTPAAVP